MKVNGIILAAGLSSRMQAFKPLLQLKKKTIIEHSVDSLLRAGVNQVVVVLGHRGDEIEKTLLRHPLASQLTFVYNHDYQVTDMLVSVKTGIAALTVCDAFYLLPGDMPAIQNSTFQKVKAGMIASSARVAFPTVDGRRKHPPLIAWECVPSILAFDKEGGLRELWKQYEQQIAVVPVEDEGCKLDADTVADYERLTEYMEKLVIP